VINLPTIGVSNVKDGEEGGGERWRRMEEEGGEGRRKADTNLRFSELERKSPESWVINLPTIGLSNVKDVIFLEGFNEPTLAVLHEPSMTSTTRYAVSKNTSVVSMVSIDLDRRKHPVIWSQVRRKEEEGGRRRRKEGEGWRRRWKEGRREEEGG
jgi:hypothetical protein